MITVDTRRRDILEDRVIARLRIEDTTIVYGILTSDETLITTIMIVTTITIILTTGMITALRLPQISRVPARIAAARVQIGVAAEVQVLLKNHHHLHQKNRRHRVVVAKSHRPQVVEAARNHRPHPVAAVVG